LSKIFLYLTDEEVPGLISILFLDGFPFIDYDDYGPAFLNDSIDELEVVNLKGREGVHDIDYKIGLLHVNHGANL